MEVLETQVELNPGMTIGELWIEAKILFPNLPSRTQFYKWLKYAYVHGKYRNNGGFKKAIIYSQSDLNLIVKFAEFRQQTRTLENARNLLAQEISLNPTNYIEGKNNEH